MYKAFPSHPYTTRPGLFSGLPSRSKSQRTNQSLPKCMAAPTHGLKMQQNITKTIEKQADNNNGQLVIYITISDLQGPAWSPA